MKRKQVKRSSIFLLELMIAILFFSVASAVCIRLFVKSHTIGQDTRNLNMALNQVSAAAEVFRSDMDMQEFLKQEFPAYEENEKGSEFLVYYDEDWKPSRAEKAVFCLAIGISGQDTASSRGCFTMTYADTKQEIYRVDFEKYTGEAVK